MLLIAATVLSALLHASCAYNYMWNKPTRCEVSMRIESGWVCGRIRRAENGDKYASFRRVPYAKPPLGLRRFKELECLEPWDSSGMLDATEDGPLCPQDEFISGPMLTMPNGMSEDCIHLNAHIPLDCLLGNRPEKPLPILVFIHDGFQSGSGLSDTWGPEYLLTKKVIVITFQFRINVFGYFTLFSKEIPGNQGLRDMVTLLRWVKRNARRFGGDPDNVTIMGVNAGSTSAHLLSLSLETKGLFKRVILVSGNAFPTFYTPSLKFANKLKTSYLKYLNITATNPKEIHRQLINMPLIKLMEGNTAMQYLNVDICTFSPIVERKFTGITRILDGNPLALIANGRGKEYPTLMGFSNNELCPYKFVLQRKNVLPQLKKYPSEILSPRLRYILNENQIKEATRKIYHRYFKGEPTLDEVTNYLSDMYFIHPALKLAEWKVAIGGAPMFNFKFSYEPEYSAVKTSHWVDCPGASHMDAVTLLFRVNSMLRTCRARAYPPKTTDDFMKIYLVFITTNFMTCGHPNGLAHEKSWLEPNCTLKYFEILEPFKDIIHELTQKEKELVKFFDSLDPEVRDISARLKATH